VPHALQNRFPVVCVITLSRGMGSGRRGVPLTSALIPCIPGAADAAPGPGPGQSR
jgi:hypothetical protein